VTYSPERGDLIWLNFSPQRGHEQAGKRPALVLSPRSYNSKVGLALVCPITNRAKGYPFEVPLPEGLAITGVVLADQVKSLDWRARQAGFAGLSNDEVIQDTLAKISVLLA
jgi:mRNA interferase MazF